ncbi:MAG: FtsX-like permease family protein [Aquificaceae bacterium]|nr:FtsX-like permease family protein [Aquificaceae bacterium]MCX7990182.1 FtsX-like permease family protein [Aquificaceae bacterium]
MKPLMRLSLRYLVSGKGSTQLVSFIALMGITLSVSALLLTMGVFAGFQEALKEKILSASPHLMVSLLSAEGIGEKEKKLKELKEVQRAYPIALYQGLISREGRLSSVSVKALKAEDVKSLYLLELKEGIVMGKGLADITGLKVGEEVLLLSPLGRRTPLGFLPRARTFSLEGTFQKGIFDQDYATVVMTMETARDFFGDDYQLLGFEVYLKDPYEAQEVRKRLEELLGKEAIVRSWIDLNKPLFNALELEKVGISFVLMLMVLIASFNITSLLFMKAKEKVRDIAVLRTFGLIRSQVLFLFLLQGLMLGLFGTLLGFLLAFAGGYLINHYKLIRVPADVYLMDHVPVHFELGDMLFTFLGAFFLSLLASLLPAYRASRESVVQVLRNE